jgi:hypothetical protein
MNFVKCDVVAEDIGIGAQISWGLLLTAEDVLQRGPHCQGPTALEPAWAAVKKSENVLGWSDDHIDMRGCHHCHVSNRVYKIWSRDEDSCKE